MMIGQIEVMKITKIAEGWASRKAASDSGSQASGGMVRSTWKIGSRPRIAHSALADQHAERDADDRRQREADGHPLQRLGEMPEGPLSMPPLSKNGSTMRSQDSVETLVGAGSDEPGAEQRSCQTKSTSAITITGGITAAPTSLAAASRSRSTTGRAGGRKATISAVAPGTGTAAAIDAVLALLAAITPPS